MSAVLESATVARVREALRAAGIAAEIVELPGAARTAKAAAEFLGCEVGQIANSLVFRGAGSHNAILVMSSGARRVDLSLLTQAAGEAVLKADAEFVRAATGFPIGGVAPVGQTGEVRAVVEKSLKAYEEIWAAAGHPNTVFRLTYADLVKLTRGLEVDVAAT